MFGIAYTAPIKKTCTIRAARFSRREQTHLNDLEKRSERSRATSPPFYLTITDTSQPPDPSPSLHSLCLYVFSNSLHCRAQPLLRWQSSGAAFSNSHWVSTVRMRSARLGLLRVKDGKEEEEDGAPLHWSLSSCWVHWGPQMQRMGTGGLRARCISAISWFPEPLTRIKRIYWFSALIGSDAPQWFYNTR